MDEKMRNRVKIEIEVYEEMARHIKNRVLILAGDNREVWNVWSEKMQEYERQARELREQLGSGERGAA
jgi:hypothetical protein